MKVPMHHLPHLQRRQWGRLWGLRALALVSAAGLAGCASTLPPRLYALRTERPGGAPLPPATPGPVLLLQAVTLPELLDREALLVPAGAAGVQPLSGHRWAEPLRDAVPRLLRHDLSLLLGADQVWATPLPPGVAVQRLLRVELLTLLASADQTRVLLQARVTLLPAAGAAPAVVQLLRAEAPAAGGSADALAQAHREVLWQLAEAVALLARR
ncbi:MAG: membrane integrity-associated transporter subunit PqiC [Rubrivivax sp.]|nr:membrane integrity-associated transporter subunit PqiC [Rubrivivax sp.]